MENVVITGASSGIGAACAKHFSDKGYSVVLAGRNQEKLKTTQQMLAGPSLILELDLNNKESIQGFAEKLLSNDSFKNITCLINNAGIYTRKPFLETSIEEWEQQFQVNLLGTVYLTQLLAPALISHGPSSIVNISSTLGNKPVPETSAYSATKAAMINFTESIALEFASKKVRCNCICPGVVDTPIHSFHNSEDKELIDVVNQMHPLGSMGEPHHVASAAYFLASNESNWTTGTVMDVDGGIHLN